MSVLTRERCLIESNGDSQSENREDEAISTLHKCDQCHRDDFKTVRGLNQHKSKMHKIKRLRSGEGENRQNAAEGTNVIDHDDSEEDSAGG